MENQVDRRDDHQHTRDFIQQHGFAPGIIRRVPAIDERMFVEQFGHDENIHGDNDGRREQCH